AHFAARNLAFCGLTSSPIQKNPHPVQEQRRAEVREAEGSRQFAIDMLPHTFVSECSSDKNNQTAGAKALCKKRRRTAPPNRIRVEPMYINTNDIILDIVLPIIIFAAYVFALIFRHIRRLNGF